MTPVKAVLLALFVVHSQICSWRKFSSHLQMCYCQLVTNVVCVSSPEVNSALCKMHGEVVTQSFSYRVHTQICYHVYEKSSISFPLFPVTTWRLHCLQKRYWTFLDTLHHTVIKYLPFLWICLYVKVVDNCAALEKKLYFISVDYDLSTLVWMWLAH